MNLPKEINREWQEINVLALAYLGDAVYELWVRTHLLALGHEKVKDLHRLAVEYVRATTQAQVLHSLLPQLDDIEKQVVLRGRNAKASHPRNVDVVTYRHATAFETLVGYWELEGRKERMDWAFEQVDRILEEMESEGVKEKFGEELDESGIDPVHS